MGTQGYLGDTLVTEQGPEQGPLQGSGGHTPRHVVALGTQCHPIRVHRYGFLLDKALIICKRRGDSYETKDIVDLQSHQLRDGGLGPRDGKKVCWQPRRLVPKEPNIQVWWIPVSWFLVDTSAQV